MKKFILAIDQGTTSSRAILFDHAGQPHGVAQQEFRQIFPHPGWVEHDANEIWQSQLAVIRQVLRENDVSAADIAAIGITNQRETTVLWDKNTGKPVHRAIVWQDRRTADHCALLKRKGHEKKFREKTGLVLDPYFSGTKIHWLLENLPKVKQKAKAGKILFGTIDSWLLWKLTHGRVHATDFTNASRTLLFNIQTHQWDDELLKILNVPRAMLPEVRNSGADFGIAEEKIVKGIPIFALIGDQQAALYGQGCTRPGTIKNTYGTGCFTVLNLGKKFQKPPFGLLATLACDEAGRSVYALEGAVFIAGAAIQWLRDGLGFFKKARETYSMATSVKDAGGVVMIPALTGLGSPYWDPHARGVITGLTRGTRREHIVRAALEGIANSTADVIEAMAKQSHKISELRVDGGATQNNFLMQFQADLLGIPILVSDITESTAWGAAKLAGMASGFWPDSEKLDHKRRYRRFMPRMASKAVQASRLAWKNEIKRLLTVF